MVQPFDYRINVAQPMAGVATGVQNALQLSRQMDEGDLVRAQTASAEADALKKADALKQADALRTELEGVARAPTSEAITALMLKHPHLSEGFQRALNGFNADEQKARVQEGTQAYAAILNGQPATASKLLRDTAGALREKGDAKQAESYERMASLVDASPEGAQTTIGLMLATAMGADKFKETFKELEDQRRARTVEPSTRREAAAKANKAESDAASAAVTAKYAESNAATDLQKKGWDITKIQEDIKIAKLNAQIASAGVAAAKEGNVLKREELGLKIEGMKADRDKATRERAAEVESSRTTMDTLVNTVDKILKFDPGVKRAALGPVDSRLPTIQQDVADFEDVVNTLGSQVFLSQAPAMKGLGALTEAEGARLEKALGSFSLRQSPESFDANVKEVQRLTLKARANLAKKYGVPDTVPDTPAAASPDAVAAALAKYPMQPPLPR